MKDFAKILLISFTALTLFGCGKSKGDSTSISSEPISEISESITEPISEPESIIDPEKDVNLKIEYVYEDGSIFSSKTETLKAGSSYSIESPEVQFMEPTEDVVSGTMGNDNKKITVVYKYSTKPVTELGKGKAFEPVFYDETRGISFNFIYEGGESDWEALLVGETFTLFNGCVEYRNDSKSTKYMCRWYDKNQVLTNKANWNSFLTSEQIILSISINKDKEIQYFKNGKLMFTFLANKLACENNVKDGSGKKITSQLVDSFIKDITIKGFRMGINGDGLDIHYSLNGLMLNYAYEDEIDAMKFVNQFVPITVKCIDKTSKMSIKNDETFYYCVGDQYEISAPEVVGYKCDTIFRGVVEASQVLTFEYESNISEHLKSDVIIDRATNNDWDIFENYYPLAENLRGNFVVDVKYHCDGCKNSNISSQCCSSTYYSIVREPTSGDRWGVRLDWYGYLKDGNGDGKNIGNDPSYETWFSKYGLNYENDLYPIFCNFDAEVVYARKGTILTITTTITPKNTSYSVYNYVCSLANVTSEVLSLYANSRNSISTLKSIRY